MPLYPLDSGLRRKDVVYILLDSGLRRKDVMCILLDSGLRRNDIMRIANYVRLKKLNIIHGHLIEGIVQ